MKAAIISLRRLGASRIVVAVPVGSPRTIKELEQVTAADSRAAPRHWLLLTAATVLRHCAAVVSRWPQMADEVVCLSQPLHFQAVGQFYEHVSALQAGGSCSGSLARHCSSALTHSCSLFSLLPVATVRPDRGSGRSVSGTSGCRIPGVNAPLATADSCPTVVCLCAVQSSAS